MPAPVRSIAFQQRSWDNEVMATWLMKSEPEEFSIADLKKVGKTLWTGVRNYQARNFMMQGMKVGDGILFYHSNAEPSGVAGLAKVRSTGHADPTQFDKKSEFYDAKSTPAAPRWFCVEIEFVAIFENFISLAQLKADKNFAKLLLLQRGSRLSIQPVDLAHFDRIVKMGQPL
jgi:predicted RNA-binding protein with PUA-like domain